MKWALKNNIRIMPNPLEKEAICPLCNESVIAKCGEIKVWHWAHKNNEDCDSWTSEETEWHLNWKDNFSKEYQEIIITKDNKKHIADIKIKNIVIEFQNSKISTIDIQKREKFYDKMKWMLNGKTLAKNFMFFEKDNFFSFKWKWFPKSWEISKKPIYIDLSFMKTELINEVDKYSNGEKHYSTCTEERWEWEDDYGNIRESNYPQYITNSYDDTKTYLKNIQKKLDILIKKDIFVIKKIYNKGTGWGEMISKENFIKECEYGYYGN